MKPFEQKITTRGYELDSESLLSPATYLRYLEHLRWLAVASQAQQRGSHEQSTLHDSGHILGSLFGKGHSVVVVAQSLLLDGDVGQGVELAASMWVRRVGRTSLDFGHVIARPDGSPLVRAVVTAVYRGPDGKPAPVPDIVRQQVMEDPVSLVELEVMAKQTPRADIAPLEAWARPVEVRPSDCDLLGHVNHANYLCFFDDTRRLAVHAGALEPSASRRLTAVTLEYRHQAVVGDPLVARVWPSSAEGADAYLVLDLRAHDILLARGWITLS